MDTDWNDGQPIYRQLRDRMVALILDGARDYVTLGEMCDALREVWGVWRETPVF